MRIFEVGGCVRDTLIDPTKKAKDIDFACEVESFDAMRDALVGRGFEIFVETPEFFTIRAHFPKDHPQHGRTTADFVMCRKDGFSSDGRRPDFVEVGTLADDLARRDFTMNAIARTLDGTLIDPFDGRADINDRLIRFVGEPMERIREDGLRILRALRFNITLGFTLEVATSVAITERESAELLRSVSTERVRDELHKMFLADTPRAFEVLSGAPSHLRDAILRPGLKLLPSMGHKVTQGE